MITPVLVLAKNPPSICIAAAMQRSANFFVGHE
jgi:hypothetical protein